MIESDRSLPQDLHMERCLLGSLLLDINNSQLAKVRKIVLVEAFMEETHRAIYRAICSLADEGKPFADAQVVATALREKLSNVHFDSGHDTGEVVADILHPLSQGYVSSCANAVFHAKEVMKLHCKRRAVALGEQLTQAGSDVNGDFEGNVQEILGKLGKINSTIRSSRRTLRAKSIADLLAEPEERVPWLIEGLLPAAGFSLLAAKPKVGKSTFARCYALAVARGEPFLGRVCDGCPTIYVGLEDKPTEITGHFHALGATDEKLLVVTELESNKETALADLRSLIIESNTRFVVIDTLARLVRLKDANDYAEVMRKLEPLLNLVRQTDCHLMALHHAGKNDREDGDSLLGSTAFYASCDVVLTLRRKQSCRTLSTRARYGVDIAPTVLGFDNETRALTASGSVSEVGLADRKLQMIPP